MIHKTERLILRPWEDEDAENLYKYAKDPLVGPKAGWRVHTSVENSLELIRSVLSAPETYAVCLKEDNKAIGSIGLHMGERGNISIAKDEAEIVFWIGLPFWGQGLIAEAVRELMRYAFEDLGIKRLWSAYFDGNVQSKRVMEKCGFKYQYSKNDLMWEPLNEVKTLHVTCIDIAFYSSISS